MPRGEAANLRVSDLDVELAAIAAGDPQAFGRWLSGAERPLRQSLRRFAAAVDTEAVLQEALLRIWQVAPRCRTDGRPNALLRLGLRIAHNLAVSELRRRRFEVGVEPERLDEEPPDPDSTLPDPLLRSRIEECRKKLPSRPAAALDSRLRDSGGHSDRDLAARLGMTLNTFLQNVTRARQHLRDCLRRLGIEVAR